MSSGVCEHPAAVPNGRERALLTSADWDVGVLPCPERSTAGHSYALLFRGRSHRWGCDAASRFLQRAALQSHHEHISGPLERLGHCVDVYLTLHLPPCYSHGEHPQLVFDLVRSASQGGRGQRGIFARWARSNLPGHGSNQLQNFRAALDWLGNASRSSPYDYTIVTRYDMRLLTPMQTWACHKPAKLSDADLIAHSPSISRTLGIASQCYSRAWHNQQCTWDSFYIVPRALFAGFSSSIGVAEPPGQRSLRCCFNAWCQYSGHGCYNVFAPRVGGAHNISFCWPDQPQSFPQNGPDFQCCRGGLVTSSQLKRLPGSYRANASIVARLNWTWSTIRRELRWEACGVGAAS